MDVREKLVELLSKYFDIGDSYCYNLTRTKNAFACGTMGFDDFEEFDEETVADIADHLIATGVTFAKDINAPSKWIPVTERLPAICETVLVCYDFMGGKAVKASDRYGKNGLLWAGIPVGGKATHWMPLPEPPKGE